MGGGNKRGTEVQERKTKWGETSRAFLACSGPEEREEMPQPAVQCLKRSFPNNALGNKSKGTDLKVQITSADPVTQLVCQSPELRDQRRHCLHKGLPAGPQGTGCGLQ